MSAFVAPSLDNPCLAFDRRSSRLSVAGRVASEAFIHA